MNLQDKTISEITSFLGANVKIIRLKHNITQDELALKSGVSRLTVVNLERGKSISLNSFVRIIRGLDCLYLLEKFHQIIAVSPVKMMKLLNQSSRKRASKKNASA